MLTYRRRLFIEHYLETGNAREAARRAKYRSPENAAKKLLHLAEVREAISARVAEVAMPANEVLARLSDHATSTLDDVLAIDDAGGWSLDVRKAKQRGRLHTIKKLKMGKEGPEVEMYDAHRALELLGRYHGLWERDTGTNDADPVGQLIAGLISQGNASGTSAEVRG